MSRSIEIKAYCRNKERCKNLIIKLGAELIFNENQIDTYFQSKTGILKLRESKSKCVLLHYSRENNKESKKILFNHHEYESDSKLKDILEKTNGSYSLVEKSRDKYQLNNVSFHIDSVKGLGDFIEIEAKDIDNSLSVERLQEQCNYYLKSLEINAKNLLSESYQELLQQNNLFNQILVDE